MKKKKNKIPIKYKRSLTNLLTFLREKNSEPLCFDFALVPPHIVGILQVLHITSESHIIAHFSDGLLAKDSHTWAKFREHLCSIFTEEKLDTLPEWIALLEFSSFEGSVLVG